MIGATYIAEDKLSIIFIAKDIYPRPAFLHDRTNYVRCHAVGNGIHLRMHLTIILTQCSGQCCPPLTAESFEKILMVIKHRFRLCVCKE